MEPRSGHKQQANQQPESIQQMTAQRGQLNEQFEQLVKALGIPAPDKKAKQLMNKFIQEQLQQGKTVEEILAQAVPVRGVHAAPLRSLLTPATSTVRALTE